MQRLLATLLMGVTIALTAPAAAGPQRAQPIRVLKVGSELVATHDVTIRDARLSQGSRVTVTHVALKNGKPVAANLELKDGHVLAGVAFRQIQKHFRVAR